MTDIIGTLKTIRGLRERRMAREEQEKARQLAAQQQAKEAADQALQEFRDQRQERVKEIYRSLIGKNLRLRDVDWFRFRLDQLKKEDARLVQEMLEQEKAVEEAAHAHHESQDKHQAAVRQVSKFDAISGEQGKLDRQQEINANDAAEEDALEALIARGGRG